MPDSGERAYAYTKACGIIGKSFVGKRIAALGGLSSLSELDRLVFPGIRRELPGRELLADLEGRILGRTVQQILSVINAYARPPELLIRQLRSYEYADLKTCLHYVAGGMKTAPAFSDIGRFRTVHFEAFPDIEAMLAGTEYTFILERNVRDMQEADLAALETELDLRYYTGLRDSLLRLSGEDRSLVERILSEEISLRNCTWALRLRRYFKKSPAETGPHLMHITMRTGAEPIPGDLRQHIPDHTPGKEISLAAEACESLELPLDSRSHWRGWRWEPFLNPEKMDELWKADPRYFQNAASEYLYRLSLRNFHRMPFSVSSGFCYIKLKQFEEDLLTSIAEGLGLGMPGRDVFELLEVPL